MPTTANTTPWAWCQGLKYSAQQIGQRKVKTTARRSLQVSPGPGRPGTVLGGGGWGFIIRGRIRMPRMMSPIKRISCIPETMGTFAE